MNRRHFLTSSTLAGAQLATHALASANDTVRVACVGVRGQGGAHIKAYSAMPNVEMETPNTLVSTFEFNEGGEGRKQDSDTVGDLFYGSKGYMAINGSSY